jgi:hypothetical protein
MSNARLRRKLERLSVPIVASLIDLGYAHNDGGILEWSYHGYCNPGQCTLEASRAINTKQVVMPVPASMQRERL